jgi:hypothetical protein
VPAQAHRSSSRRRRPLIYKKLEVGSQGEMLLRYFAPISGKAPRTDATLDPNWSDDPSPRRTSR